MKLVLTEKKKINQLVTIFRNLKGIVTDVNIRLTNESFYIQSMDKIGFKKLSVILKSLFLIQLAEDFYGPIMWQKLKEQL